MNPVFVRIEKVLREDGKREEFGGRRQSSQKWSAECGAIEGLCCGGPQSSVAMINNVVIANSEKAWNCLSWDMGRPTDRMRQGFNHIIREAAKAASDSSGKHSEGVAGAFCGKSRN